MQHDEKSCKTKSFASTVFLSTYDGKDLRKYIFMFLATVVNTINRIETS